MCPNNQDTNHNHPEKAEDKKIENWLCVPIIGTQFWVRDIHEEKSRANSNKKVCKWTVQSI